MKKINLIILLSYLFIGLPSHTMWTNLHQAAKDGNLEDVRTLIDAGQDFTVTDQYGNTPLHWAAFHDNAKVVTLLIERGANINLPISLVGYHCT